MIPNHCFPTQGLLQKRAPAPLQLRPDINYEQACRRAICNILSRDHLICYEKGYIILRIWSAPFSHVNFGYELSPKPLVAFEMFLARLSTKRPVFPILTRSASSVTRPRGLAAILEKKPDDVVITFAKRTAVGRAKRGQLKDAPVDEILHALFKVLSPRF